MPSRRNDNKPSHPLIAGRATAHAGTGRQAATRMENKVDEESHRDGVRPVQIVSSLPTIPDDDYPEGAVVVNLADGYVYRNVSDSWVFAAKDSDALGGEASAEVLGDISDAQSTADGKIETFYQDAEPAGGALGDLWFDTDDGNTVYRHDGNGWVLAKDDEIAQAINDAAGAQATADGKVTTFYADSEPTAEGVGDLWVDTDDNNRLRRWDGSGWVDVRDTAAGDSSSANLLGPDAGPEHTTTGSATTAWNYATGSEDTGYAHIDEFGVVAGEVYSLLGQLKSDGTKGVEFLINAADDASGANAVTVLKGSNENGWEYSTSYVVRRLEGWTFPSGKTHIRILVNRRNSDPDGQTWSIRATLNRGPVAAPYSEPLAVVKESSSVNLLPAGAGEETAHSGSAASAMRKEPLENLGLDVGDTISIRGKVKGDGNTRVQIRAFDASGTFFDSGNGNYVTGSSYGVSRAENYTIPAGTESLSYVVQDINGSGSFSSKQRSMNVGPVAHHFTRPSIPNIEGAQLPSGTLGPNGEGVARDTVIQTTEPSDGDYADGTIVLVY